MSASTIYTKKQKQIVMLFYTFLRPLFMLLLGGLLWCCSFPEEHDSCPMYVQFVYDYNMANEDKFAEQCGRIELFVFDESGRLVQRIIDEGSRLSHAGYRIPLSLNSGTYTLMAWGGSLSSFYYLSEPETNVSLKEDIVLQFDSRNGESASELNPLWNGTPVTFTIEQAYGHTETVSLVKNTNRINLTLYASQGTTLPAAGNIDVKLTAANGSYHVDNLFADTQQVTYRPFNEPQETDGKIVYSLSTLRLVQGENVRLEVTDRTTGRSLLSSSDMDLIDYLLETLPATMQAQEYLDRQDTWEIELYLGSNDVFGETAYTAIMIKINGWTVWSSQSGIL